MKRILQSCDIMIQSKRDVTFSKTEFNDSFNSLGCGFLVALCLIATRVTFGIGLSYNLIDGFGNGHLY